MTDIAENLEGRQVMDLYPHWEVWWIESYVTHPVRWCARLAGAPIAMVHAWDMTELIAEIERWEHRTPRQVDEHVLRLRRTLDRMPESFARERAFLLERIKWESRTCAAERTP